MLYIYIKKKTGVDPFKHKLMTMASVYKSSC